MYELKAQEELKAILHVYSDQYFAKFGEKPSLVQLRAKIESLKEEQKEKVFLTQFGNLKPQELQSLISILNELEDVKDKHSKGKR